MIKPSAKVVEVHDFFKVKSGTKAVVCRQCFEISVVLTKIAEI